MDNIDDQGTGAKRPPDPAAPATAAPGEKAPPRHEENDPLIDQARKIIYQTPEIRTEKVALLKEALEQGTYEVDSRKLANILIAKLLLEDP